MALSLDNETLSAADLTGYVRAALEDLPENAFTLSAFLPDVTVDDVDFRANVGGGGLARVAKFRAYDTESPISSRGAARVISGELPPISVKTRLDEYTRLKMRHADQAIVDALREDGLTLAKQILARAEVARGQLLQTGKVTLNENGLTLEADFGRAAKHTQTATTLWGAGGNVVDDLLAWAEVYAATNGARPGRILVSRQILSTVIRNKSLAEAVYGSNPGTRLVKLTDLNDLLAAHGLPAFEVYEAKVAGAPNPADVLDPKSLLFLPGADQKIGETLWGTTAEAIDADYGIDSTEAPGIVVGTYSDKDPVAQWTKASAIMLPVAPNTNLTLSAKVLS